VCVCISILGAGHSVLVRAGGILIIDNAGRGGGRNKLKLMLDGDRGADSVPWGGTGGGAGYALEGGRDQRDILINFGQVGTHKSKGGQSFSLASPLCVTPVPRHLAPAASSSPSAALCALRRGKERLSAWAQFAYGLMSPPILGAFLVCVCESVCARVLLFRMYRCKRCKQCYACMLTHADV
jgi:hypothetical protein